MSSVAYLKQAIFLIIVAIFVLSFSSCAWVRLPHKSTPSFYPKINSDEIDGEIDQIEKSLENMTDYSERVTSIFRLASLYSHPENKSPDYKSALERYEEFILLNPDSPDAPTVRYVMALLTEIDNNRRRWNQLQESSKQISQEGEALGDKLPVDDETSDSNETTAALLAKKNNVLAHENAKLKKENKDLADQIVKMREIIEKLKYLDIRLEKKRRDNE